MGAARVLVVDDNPTNLKLLRVLLAGEGYEVETATSAEEAESSIGAEVPDLVLMDIQLPGVDGLTLTRRLKADPRTRGVLVIAVTAYAMRGDEEKAIEAGCDAYLTKPIDTRGLPGVLARMLEGRSSAARG
jgi:two-component system, cell cycle response regulator DivK